MNIDLCKLLKKVWKNKKKIASKSPHKLFEMLKRKEEHQNVL